MITIPQRHRQTDGQTTCRSNTVLCVASRGKNGTKVICNRYAYYLTYRIVGVEKYCQNALRVSRPTSKVTFVNGKLLTLVVMTVRVMNG